MINKHYDGKKAGKRDRESADGGGRPFWDDDITAKQEWRGGEGVAEQAFGGRSFQVEERASTGALRADTSLDGFLGHCKGVGVYSEWNRELLEGLI